MLVLGFIVEIFTSQGHCTAIGNLAAPICFIGHAVDIDLAGFVSKVETAVLGIESADSSGELEISVVVSSRDEILDCLGNRIAVVTAA